MDTLLEEMVKTIVKGNESELPIRTQAELYILTLDSNAAKIGCAKPSNQPAIILTIVCVAVKPYLWNGFHTKMINLSRDMNKVEMFDICSEYTLIVPRLRQRIEVFQE